MNLIQQCFNNFVRTGFIFLLLVSSSYSQAHESNTVMSFASEKQQAAKAVGCSDLKDFACQRIYEADNPDMMWASVKLKISSDEKQIFDRLNVLDCCLGINEQKTCEGISRSTNKDYLNCRKQLKGKKN